MRHFKKWNERNPHQKEDDKRMVINWGGNLKCVGRGKWASQTLPVLKNCSEIESFRWKKVNPLLDAKDLRFDARFQ